MKYIEDAVRAIAKPGQQRRSLLGMSRWDEPAVVKWLSKFVPVEWHDCDCGMCSGHWSPEPDVIGLDTRVFPHPDEHLVRQLVQLWKAGEVVRTGFWLHARSHRAACLLQAAMNSSYAKPHGFLPLSI